MTGWQETMSELDEKRVWLAERTVPSPPYQSRLKGVPKVMPLKLMLPKAMAIGPARDELPSKTATKQIFEVEKSMLGWATMMKLNEGNKEKMPCKQ